jgi:hypothetical protein
MNNNYYYFPYEYNSCVWTTVNGRMKLLSQSSHPYYDRVVRISSLLGAIVMMK